MNFENRPTHSLRPYPGNARTHSPKQIRQISRSIERFGFNNPVLVDDDDQIIAGHGRVEAAKLLGLKTVPTVRLSHLSEAEKKAYILADVDIIIEGIGDESEQPENVVPEENSGPPVSRLGDVWMLGKHILVCGVEIISAIDNGCFDRPLFCRDARSTRLTIFSTAFDSSECSSASSM
jgi:hypothetical protein